MATLQRWARVALILALSLSATARAAGYFNVGMWWRPPSQNFQPTWLGANGVKAQWATGGLSISGNSDGFLNQPYASAASPDGSYLYVADYGNNRVSRFTISDGVFAGWIGWIGTAVTGGDAGCSGSNKYTPGWCLGGAATAVSTGNGGFSTLSGIAVSPDGSNLYVSQYNNNRVEKYVASNGAFLGWVGNINGSPTGGAAGCSGASSGLVTPGWCKGGTSQAGTNGDGSLSTPYGIAVSSDGASLFVTDYNNFRVNKYATSTGAFQGWIGDLATYQGVTIGGNSTAGTKGDGSLTTANAAGLSPNGSYVYVPDPNTSRLNRYWASTGLFAGWIGYINSSASSAPTGGDAGCSGSTNKFTPGWCEGGASTLGTAGDGSVYQPYDVDASADGTYLYVADENNNRINKYAASTGAFVGWIGHISSPPTGGVAGCNGASNVTPGWCKGGTATTGTTGDGSIQNPYGVSSSIDGSYLYVADYNNNRINKYAAPSGAFLGWIGRINSAPTGGAIGCSGTGSGFTPGWCVGGTAASNSTADGSLTNPYSVAASPEGSFIYVLNMGSSTRLDKYDANTGTYMGWTGYISGAPTGGDAGCSGATNRPNPGWCLGGSATWFGGSNNGPIYITSYGVTVSPDGSYIYVASVPYISRYASNGVFMGWIGRVGTSPTGGAAGCNGASTGQPTPGWCIGGGAAQSSAGDGSFSNPHRVGISPDGSYLFVPDSNKVGKYNATSGSFLGWFGNALSVQTFATGGSSVSGTNGDGSLASPMGVGVSPNGSYLYVSDYTSARVNRYAQDTGTFLGWIGYISSAPTGGDAGCSGASSRYTPGWCFGGTSTNFATADGSMYQPLGVASSLDGTYLYVVNASGYHVDKYVASTASFVGWMGSIGSAPTGGAAGCAGTSSGFTPGWCKGGSGVSSRASDGSLSNPRGAAVSVDGSYLFVADGTSSSGYPNRVNRYSSGNGTYAGWIGGNAVFQSFGSGGTSVTATGDGMMTQPQGVTLSPNGSYLYMIDFQQSRVQKYNSNGDFLGWIGYIGSAPTGGDAGCSGATNKLTPGWCLGGSSSSSYGATAGMGNPNGLQSSIDGSYVYVADSSNNRISRYVSTSGAFGGWIGHISSAPTGGAAGCSGASGFTPGWCTGGSAGSGTAGDGSMSSPTSLTVSSDGSFLFVVETGNHRVSQFATQNGAFVGWIGHINSSPTGGTGSCNGASGFTPGWCIGGTSSGSSNGDGSMNSPRYAQISADGSYLYVANVAGGNISRYVVSTAAFQGWIGGVSTSPTGGTAGCTGLAAAAATPGWCFGGVSANYSTTGAAYSNGFALSPSGRTIYSANPNGRIDRFYASTGYFAGWLGKVSTSPTGGDAGCSGLAVGTATSGWCQGGSSTNSTGDGGLSAPQAPVLYNNSLYVPDYGNARIVRINLVSP